MTFCTNIYPTWLRYSWSSSRLRQKNLAAVDQLQIIPKGREVTRVKSLQLFNNRPSELDPGQYLRPGASRLNTPLNRVHSDSKLLKTRVGFSFSTSIPAIRLLALESCPPFIFPGINFTFKLVYRQRDDRSFFRVQGWLSLEAKKSDRSDFHGFGFFTAHTPCSVALSMV